MLASRIYVMHDAHVVETGSTEKIFERPEAPYTRLLLGAMSP
jgi:ABC-type oligopeptide transport system ATPase subunit